MSGSCILANFLKRELGHDRKLRFICRVRLKQDVLMKFSRNSQFVIVISLDKIHRSYFAFPYRISFILDLCLIYRIYILSLRHYLACRGMKPMMNFFFQGWTFFLETKGRSIVQPRSQAEAKQAKLWSREKKKSNQGKKSSSKVSVSSTAAKYHVLEGRYIFFSVSICPITRS